MLRSDLPSYLPSELDSSIKANGFKIKLLDIDSKHISSADELIEDRFPSEEADEYKPGSLLSEDNSYCIAAIKDSMVVACITVTFDLNQHTANVHSLAVDKEFENRKLGSILLLALDSLCRASNITYVSLISSENGKLLYKSFGFKELAMNSFEASIPFNQTIINGKIANIANQYPAKKEKFKQLKRTTPLAFFVKKPKACKQEKKDDAQSLTPSAQS